MFTNFEHISHLFLVFRLVDFEQVNVSWDYAIFLSMISEIKTTRHTSEIQ